MPASKLITPTPTPIPKISKNSGSMPASIPAPAGLDIVLTATPTTAPELPPLPDDPYVSNMPAVPPGTPMPISLPFAGNPDGVSSKLDQSFIQFFDNAFNVDITAVNSDTMSARAAAASLPDVIPTTSLSSLYLPFILQKDYSGSNTIPGSKNGMRVREIPDNIISKYPELKKMMTSNEVSKAIADNNGGKYYSLPRLASYPADVPYSQSSFVVRKDWAQKAGYSTLPGTVDGFANMLKDITQVNPATFNGEVAVGFAGKLQDLNFTPWIGAGLFDWIKEDGKIIPGYMSKHMEAALQYYKNLYSYQVPGNSAAKVMPDSFVSTNSDAAFNTGALNLLTNIRRRSSAYAITGTPQLLYKSLSQGFFANNYFNPKDIQADGKTANDYAFANENVPIPDVLELNPPLSLNANDSAMVAYNPEIACTMFSASVSDEKLDRILSIYNYILTGSGSDVVNYGILNVDWNYTFNSAFQSTQLADRFLSAADIYKSQQMFTVASFAPTPQSKLYSNLNLTWNTTMADAQNALLKKADYAPRTGSTYSFVSINQFVSYFFDPNNYTDAMNQYPNIKKTDPNQSINIDNFLKDRAFTDIIRDPSKTVADYQAIRDKYSITWGGQVMTDMVNAFATKNGWLP
jgi:hypothetical protein